MSSPDSIKEVSEERAEQLVDLLVLCAYCKEPFKECDTLVPGVGVIIGETNVVEYAKKYWHRGCVEDFTKSRSSNS